MVEVFEIPDVKTIETEATMDYQDEEMKEVHPKSEETLIELLTKCKGRKSVEVSLCSKCSAIFDKVVAKVAAESVHKKFH